MRNKVIHQLDISKRKYYQSQFLGCGSDSALVWKLINTLTNSQVKTHSDPNKWFNPINSQHTGNPEKIANIFNLSTVCAHCTSNKNQHALMLFNGNRFRHAASSVQSSVF